MPTIYIFYFNQIQKINYIDQILYDHFKNEAMSGDAGLVLGTHDAVNYFIVVCAPSNLVLFRYDSCACFACNDFVCVSRLLDKGSEDIQVLPNGLAFITSVSSE